ncbi:ribosomal protein L1p/L10e family [Artemisia annua]|uniref:CL1 n=1 Tax=Artemisia annua TaxID=35608 RepID=A0A2U1ME96_ARTAN|nr:ribosomal protein L1p/L10e family [Artemisia annua]
MAALTRLISQARRHVIRSSPFQSLHRSLCSSPSLPSDPNETNKPQRPEPTPIQPVSYAVKPKEPEKQPDPIEPTRPLSREDVRFVRDFNNPVSYGQKVAPLPEDRVGGEGEGEGGVDLEAERRKIEAENRVMRRVFRGQEEEQKVPFPVMVKVEKTEDKGDGKKVALDLKEAVHLVKANAKCNFDETLEAHVKMAVDLRRTDLKLAGSLSLPHGSGKALKVAVFAEGPAADEARAAGADLVGGEDLIEGIKSGKINIKEIDKCITVPQLMPRISKEISKKLNRLTPNPRDGSVTTDISTAVKEAKKNIKFKKDKTAIVHVGLGKVSFTEEALCENVGAFVNALLQAKPAGLKKSSKYAGYVTTFHICSTMGQSYPVSIQSLSIAADRYAKQQLR